MFVSFWALDYDGTYIAPLPDVATWDVSPILNGVGTVRIVYPSAGRNFEILRESVTQDRDLLVAVWYEGHDAGSLRAYLNTSDGDDVEESGTWTFAGNLINVRMEEAVVWPRTEVADPPSGPAPTEDLAAARFYSASAGSIMATLMQESHGRGTLTDIGFDFDEDVDSNGVPWSSVITLKIAPGTTLSKVLESLVGGEMCEWDIVDNKLFLWDTGTRGVDHTEGPNPLILRAGRDVLDAPRKHTVREAGTTLLVAGGEGLYDSEDDPTALARRDRRIERYASQGSITNEGSLTAYMQAQLQVITKGAMEVGHGVVLDPNGPLPLVDYAAGDWLYSDVGYGLERLRVVQPTLSGDQHGLVSAGVSLNDLIADELTKQAQRIDGIVGATTVTGTSNAEPADQGPDTMPPHAPTITGADSLAYQEGIDRWAAVYIDWDPVTTNADLTAANDVAGYRVQWRPVASMADAWQFGADQAGGDSAGTSFGGVESGIDIRLRVAAYDSSNNESAWSDEWELTTETDDTPPPIPSTPTLTSRNGVLHVLWDGNGSEGEPMPIDLDFVEVHVSEESGFTPTALTYYDQLSPGGGVMPIQDLEYGPTWFVRLVAVDKTTPVANRSDPSAQGSGSVAKVVADDIFEGAVGSLQLADLAVTSAKINLLAVNDAQVGSLGAGKITTGTMSAALTLSGIIRTASSGRRMQIDSNGWVAYKADGTTVFAELDVATETMLMTGTYLSALTAERIRLDPDGSIRWYGASGSDYASIANNGANLLFQSRADGSGRRSYIEFTGSGLSVSWGTSSTRYSGLDSGRTFGVIRAPVTGARVLTQHTTGDGTEHRWFIVQSDSGGDIGQSVMHVMRASSDRGIFIGASADAGIKPEGGVLEVVKGSGMAFAPCRGESFLETSSIVTKTNVVPIRQGVGRSAGALTQEVRIKEWERTLEALPPRPEKPGHKLRRVDELGVESWVDAEWDWPEAPRRKQYGPIAEELEKVAPSMVVTDVRTGAKFLDLLTTASVGWASAGEAHDRLDGHDAELAALRAEVRELRAARAIPGPVIVEGEVA